MEHQRGCVSKFEDGSGEIIAACIEVHRHLGPGLLESVYKKCLIRELRGRELRVERERFIAVRYKDMVLHDAYRLDLLVEDRFIVEVKAVERLLPVHEAQAITYLRLTGLPTALLVNFNVDALRHGIRRLSNTKPRLPEGAATPSDSAGDAKAGR